MNRSPRLGAFTLVEMITVIAIIAILAGLVLAVNGVAQSKAARSRAQSEIVMLSSAIESYKTDNGGYPQDVQASVTSSVTDSLDPRKTAYQTADHDTTGNAPYSAASRFLYGQLTGDTSFTGVASNMTKNYAPDFWKPSRLGGTKTNGVLTGPVGYIQDPYGNSYGYGTAGLADDQQYRLNLATPSTAPSAARKGWGFNPTFDLWCTAGDTSRNLNKWVKNW